jgi:hypothetical protein
MTSLNPIKLVDAGIKQEATIPLAIQKGLYGDTMLQPQHPEWKPSRIMHFIKL